MECIVFFQVIMFNRAKEDDDPNLVLLISGDPLQGNEGKVPM